jgi:predicted ATPase/DNA-binding XRE family transcriptional regulator
MSTQFTFEDWLRQRRKALDLTQEDLAQRVNCALVTIQKIESGQRRPSRQLAALLAQHLQIPASEVEAFITLARAGGPAGLITGAPINTQLPSPLTSFVGRQQEIESISHTLLQPHIHLLTLTGPPGVGKTRLAIQAADRLRQEFEYGVSFIALATACDAELVIPLIAHNLGFSQAGPGPILPRLQAGLQGRSMLLVLDNFEQVIEAAPQIASLLQACPSLKLLVTSRLALQISGEQRFLVEPLPVPLTGSTALDDPASLDAYAAVHLFVARVRSYRPEFRLTKHNLVSIRQICNSLDGLPLAIELAAAQLRVLTPTELARQLQTLQRPLDLLGDGPRDLPARQQQFSNAVQWSYSLLDEPSQRLFRHAALFAGGFDFQALAALGVAQTPQQLTPLLEHHLLRREVFETQDSTRFNMLETMRAYGLERLAELNEDLPARQRHAEFFLALARPAEGRSDWLGWCELEHDNLRLALQWFIGQGHFMQTTQMCLYLISFWELFGYQREALLWLESAQAFLADLPFDWQIDLLYSLSLINWQLGDFDAAAYLCLQALSLCRAGDLQSQDPFSSFVLEKLDSQPFSARAGLERRAMTLWLNLARSRIEKGDYRVAEAAARQSLNLASQVQDSNGVSGALLHLGEIALALDEWSEARRLQEEAWQQLPDPANSFWGVLIQQNLGELYLLSEQYSQAWQSLIIALDLASKLRHERPLTLVLAMCAGWLATAPESSLDDRQQAVRIWAAVWQQRNRSGLAFSKAHHQRIDDWQAQTRASLGSQLWEAAWQQGLSLPLQDCIQWLLAR